MSTQLVAGKVVLVTGAASGIGRAAVQLFAEHGAMGIVLVDIDERGAEEAAESARAGGAKTRVVVADVTVEDHVARMVESCRSTFGRLDCAFNNAGITGPRRSFDEMPLDEFDRVVRLDLTAVFLCMKHELGLFVQQGGGVIVNTSSGAGLIGYPGLPHYVAAKHGVLGLTKTAALEYATRGIRVNAICPGVTDTPMVRASIGRDPSVDAALRATLPTGEYGTPEQVAGAAVWLCSDMASFVNGESVVVDGGSVCR
jgi:NAD(P)-dependent dehydrogenase (short-subunit alcohol dehydrogenase family)